MVAHFIYAYVQSLGMKKKVNRFVFWTPRVFIVLFAFFLAIFSLDVFDSASSLSEILVGLFMHNLPSLVLLVILKISWKRDLVGGVIFMALGVACVVSAIVTLLKSQSWAINPILIIGSIVFLFVGILFLVGWFKKNI